MVIGMIVSGMALAGGPTAEVTGACPGPLEIAAGPFAPEVDVLVFGALDAGDTALPGGPCAGTHVGLDGPRLLRRARTGRDGFLRMAPTIDEPFCDALVEVVDTEDCATTGATPLRSVPGFSGIYAAHGRAGPSADFYGWFRSNLTHIDPDTLLMTPVSDPGYSLTALSFSPDGDLFGVEAGGAAPPRIVQIQLDGSADVIMETDIGGGLPGFSIGPDGVAYGWYQREGRFVTIDLDAATILSDVPAPPPGPSLCMAHHADGTLYAVTLSSLYAIDPLAPEAPAYLGEIDWRRDAFSGVGCTFHDGLLYIQDYFSDLHAVDVATLVATDLGLELDREIDAMASPTP